jgi:hypothetical protein
VTFDFEIGTPTLTTGQSVPFDQTSGGVTAHFSSPQGAVFSVQTDVSTGFTLSQFSGRYLYDNNLNRNYLDIQFSQQISSLTLTFATADFQQNEVPTTIQLTAYEDSTATPAVGSATAHGTYPVDTTHPNDTLPQGTLSFTSAAPFNLVEIVLPPQPLGITDFLVDNITVTTTTLAPTDTPTATSTATPTSTPMPAASPTPTHKSCVGDCNSTGQVTVDELLTMVNIALGNADVSTCLAGDANHDGQVTIDEILTAVNNALNGCGFG